MEGVRGESTVGEETTMNYETAKELKKAGFPQTGRKGVPASDVTELPEGVLKVEGEFIAIPTLSELIEACGEEFDTLQNAKGTWLALSYTNAGEEDAEPKIWTQGKTPEIAVANLWLVLNKK